MERPRRDRHRLPSRLPAPAADPRDPGHADAAGRSPAGRAVPAVRHYGLLAHSPARRGPVPVRGHRGARGVPARDARGPRPSGPEPSGAHAGIEPRGAHRGTARGGSRAAGRIGHRGDSRRPDGDRAAGIRADREKRAGRAVAGTSGDDLRAQLAASRRGGDHRGRHHTGRGRDPAPSPRAR